MPSVVCQGEQKNFVPLLEHYICSQRTQDIRRRQGFIQDFFLGGKRLCAGKLISCSHRPQPPRGFGGMLPQINFEILSPLRVI